MNHEGMSFEGKYSDGGFWDKVTGYAKAAGLEVIEKALWLYYAAQGESTPLWAKSSIYSALGYFVFPLDAIPDAIPVIGFTDDLGLLTAAVAFVAAHIDDEVKDNTAKKLKTWFG